MAAKVSSDSPSLLLHVAARRGDVAVVKYLLAQNADPQEKEPYTGNTPLHVAALAGQLECIEALLPYSVQSMVNTNKMTALSAAAATGNLDAVKAFYKGETKTKIVGRYALIRRAMSVATTSEIIIYLSSFGPKVLEMRKGGRMALACAAQDGRVEALKALLDLGVEPKKSRKDGKSATMFAAENGRHECLSLLLDHGVNIIETDYRGQTALHKACVKGSAECVEMLLARGANMHARDHFGMTALHKAARHGHTKCVEILLDHGADRTRVDKLKQMPLDYAKLIDLKEMIDLLSA